MASSMGKYANVKVSCTNENMGCTWRGLFKELDDHSSSCDKDLLRNAIISIQRLEARLDLKDRESFFLKNDFALKIEHISKERKNKAKAEFERFETLAARITDEMNELKKQNKEDNEAQEEEINNMKDETKENKEEIKKLKEEIEQLKKENGGLRKELETSTGDKASEAEHGTAITTLTTSSNSSVSPIIANPRVKAEISKTYFDLVDGDEPLGRFVVKLFTEKAPNNCAKFIKLCTHETGVGYRGSACHFRGSNYVGLGAANYLVYPSDNRSFPAELITPAENKDEKHDRSRLISLYGKSTTKSGFRLMFGPCPYENGTSVIGEVTDDTWFVVERTKKVENISTIKIADCGVIE